jgi:hypothetical protein
MRDFSQAWASFHQYVTELPAHLRNAPPWALILGTILICAVLLGALPFAGWILEKRRARESLDAYRDFHGENFFANQPDSREEPIWVPSRVGIPQRFGALDVTFAGASAIDSSPTTIVTVLPPAVPELFPAFEGAEPEEPDHDLDSPEHGEDESESLPDWGVTGSFAILEDLIEEAEIEDEASEAFRADPLSTWLLPPEDDAIEAAEFDKSFRRMVALGFLTGEGADIETEWAAWNLYEGANA